MTIMILDAADIPMDRIAAFCRKWKIAELSLFGSMAAGDARPGSDVDLLVTFEPDADWSLLDHAQMEIDLEAMLGRSVDLVSRRAVERSENAIRREHILSSARSLYRAA